MKILTQLRFYVVVATLSFTGLLISYFKNLDELKETKEELVKYQTINDLIPGGDITSANKTDSLYDELFNTKVQNGRYETSLEYLQEVNPKAAQQFVNFMNHETE